MGRADIAPVAVLAAAALSACAYVPKPAVMSKLPVYPSETTSHSMLKDLPPPERPVAVAVYGFSDQTGQFKNPANTQTLSRAVSQGSGAMLLRSLQEAGNRSWFTIVEREQLKDLLNERQLIRDMRAQYLGEHEVNPQALPALLFAGVLLEGGVVGYDTNTVTGGIGAAMLGIGGDAKYQQDTVTVYLRAVSVKTGEVLTSVTTSKTITSYAVDVNVYRYVSASSILETENGFTTNEPAMLALQQAIDKAVYGLIMEGVGLRLWNFADPQAAWPSVWRYQQERDGRLSAAQVAAAESRAHRPAKTLPAQADDPPRPPPAAMASPAARGAPSALNVRDAPPAPRAVDFVLSQPLSQTSSPSVQAAPQAPFDRPLPAPSAAQAPPAPQSATPVQRASAPS